jgi:hypothetical protein
MNTVVVRDFLMYVYAQKHNMMHNFSRDKEKISRISQAKPIIKTNNQNVKIYCD